MNIDSGKIKSKWHKRNYSFGIWVDPPGQCWEDYTHAVDELLMVVEGKLETEIAGKLSFPKIGEEVFIPAGVIHSVRNIDATTARWLYGYYSE